MSHILFAPTVLCLNANWLPIRVANVREAILAMTSDSGEDGGAAVALDIQYKQENGKWLFDESPEWMIPTTWADWIKLPIRDYDSVINSARLAIRAPSVIISLNYRKMPMMRFRPSKRVIYEREKGRCAYTGKQLSFASSTLDHATPRSRGGRDTFENLVLCDPKVNFNKADRTPEEAGLKLLIKPTEPTPIPMATKIRHTANRDWRLFIMKDA